MPEAAASMPLLVALFFLLPVSSDATCEGLRIPHRPRHWVVLPKEPNMA